MSSFGTIYRVHTFGESHSKGVGCVIDGFPSNFQVNLEAIQAQLNRRRPGQSHITTNRNEKDVIQVISGLNHSNITLGSPIMIMVNNEDMRVQDYGQFENVPRPGHADLTYQMKYGIRAESGGGRSSARETIGRVIAGALAQQYLKGIQISAWVSSVGEIETPKDIQNLYLINPPTQNEVDQSIIRNPNFQTASQMISLIEQVKEAKDSIGGTITCAIKGCPPGLGEPCFDKVQALLAHAMLSIPACKGFEFGSGFDGTKMRGSQHNDVLQNLVPKTNHSGGTLGGITNGDVIYFKVAFKPVSTIGIDQLTSDFDGKEVLLQAKGRHDPCVLPRAVPIVENMAALVIMDLMLQK